MSGSQIKSEDSFYVPKSVPVLLLQMFLGLNSTESIIEIWKHHYIFIISQLWLTSHPRSTVVLLDIRKLGSLGSTGH